MNDWLGLVFFILFFLGIFIGLKILSKPQKRTIEEFERKAAEGAETLNAGMMALDRFLNPAAARAEIVKADIKNGRYNKKKREGKGNGNITDGENNEPETN